MSFTNATLLHSKFIWNYASLQGGTIAITQKCVVYFEDVLFLGCSSETGGVFSITERSSLIIYNSTFTKNFAKSAAIFYVNENYDSEISIKFANFIENESEGNLFDVSIGVLSIFDSYFMNNTNTIFYLRKTNITFNNVIISNNYCYSWLAGCIIDSNEFSNISIYNMYLHNIFPKEIGLGNLEIESSFLTLYNVNFENLSHLEGIGACVKSINSDIVIENGNFISYDFNCLYGENSNISIKNSSFQNGLIFKPETNTNFNHFGSIYCLNCLNLVVSNSSFMNNSLVKFGGSISILSMVEIINDLSFDLNGLIFAGNKAIDYAGVIYLSNVDGVIYNCTFSENQADYGAAIYFFSIRKPNF